MICVLRYFVSSAGRPLMPADSRETDMQFDRAKLKALILHAINSCDASQVGAVKLHKVLYFADMLHFAETGTPIVGATYRKRPHGPTCDELLPALRELELSGDIKVRNVNYFGYAKKEFEPISHAETERFSEHAMALIDEVIDFVCRRNTAKTISDFSHARPWEMAGFGEVMPYSSAFYLYPSQASPESLEWGQSEAKKLEAARSNKDALGVVDFRAFRDRVLARG